jgi:Fur family ferric uptake transcriptional regulator
MKKILNTIKSAGGRLTKIRKSIIEVLSLEECLLSRQEIIDKLKIKSINPDRSTVYRELLFLTENQLIQKNIIGKMDYYEIPKIHHHHLVCLKCHKIENIKMKNFLKNQERQINKKNKFNIINHSLEFYGFCQKCLKPAK